MTAPECHVCGAVSLEELDELLAHVVSCDACKSCPDCLVFLLWAALVSFPIAPGE